MVIDPREAEIGERHMTNRGQSVVGRDPAGGHLLQQIVQGF